MKRLKRSHEIDMTNGPIFSKIITFAFPLMLTGILQLFFNAADVVVVGKFAGSLALAAVGSTGSLVNLLVNVFIGISTGVNVLAARYYGSRQAHEMSRCVHNSILLSLILGVFVCIWGTLLSTPMLRLMKTDPNVLPLASLYLRIYFLGVPATVVYNFGAAVLRSIGDTDRPLRFLLIAGIVNVLLNLITVVGLHMSVAGVAIATAASQYVAAILVILCLMKSQGIYRLQLKKLRIYKDMLIQTLQIGIPAGLQSTLFSVANVTIQSAINSFGHVVMAGNSAAASVDGFIYVAMNSFYHATLSFTSQNMGAKKYDRLNRVLFSCVGSVIATGITISLLIYSFGPQLLSLYVSANDPDRDAVLAAGMVRLTYVGLPYFLCGLMEVVTGALRGIGKSWTPLIISTIGACFFRIFWVSVVFRAFPSLEVLYWSYPISWLITPTAHFIALYLARRKMAAEIRSAAE